MNLEEGPQPLPQANPTQAHPPDVLIAGAGIIGLALALELHTRGARVTVCERDTALAHASTAAAGMLAAADPHNPPQLRPLADLSLTLYPSFLARIEALSGLSVPIQTHTTFQHHPDATITKLPEQSIDPRQLATALIAAVRNTNICLLEHTLSSSLTAQITVDTTGAWSTSNISPRKGQMLRVHIPPSHALNEVHRSKHVYIVPRTQGPQAGSSLIGATIEDAGFDTTTHLGDLQILRAHAATLLPFLADEVIAPTLESWAGLRPATPDLLPILGAATDTPNHFIATGHFRNGILLAPATAVVLADLIGGTAPTIDLTAFLPNRFA